MYVLAALTDWYDGWVARRYGYDSRWGKFLDPLADKILAAAALFSFAALRLADAWMVWIIVIRDFLITGLRSYAELNDRPIVTSKTAQAKTFGEFVVIYYALILYVANFNPLIRANYGDVIDTLMHHDMLFGMLIVVTLSTIGTGIMYLIDNRNSSSNSMNASSENPAKLPCRGSPGSSPPDSIPAIHRLRRAPRGALSACSFMQSPHSNPRLFSAPRPSRDSLSARTFQA